jgi:hypothetical protein
VIIWLCRWLCFPVAVLIVTGCTPGSGRPPLSTPAHSRAVLPAAETTVVSGATAAELALAISQALFHHSPAVVLAAEDDEANLAQASKNAIEMGAPLLLTPPEGNAEATNVLRGEINRLDPSWLVTVGDAAKQWASSGAAASVAPVNVVQSASGTPTAPLDQLLVLALDEPNSRAAVATARATGARVLLLRHPDPRTSDEAITALAGQSTTRLLAVGSAFGSMEQLRQRVDTAATGVRLPGGGQVVFPGRRMIALYGHPGDTQLGSLGEQSVRAAVTRAQKVASAYKAQIKEPVIPAFEIIATVASSSAGPDGDYSSESSIAHLQPWVDAAREAGVYVVLDLQPGTTDFLTQAKRYTQLLEQPHVGLALDPEWRLKPDQRHMRQIGSVTTAEINATAAWLAQLTRERKLPQKVLMLHQFRLDMITNRTTLNTGHDELKIVIHADGFGTPGQKMETWRALHHSAPGDILWGWKNFYDEDRPTFTPAQTMAIEPKPVFISYQ